MCIQEEGSLLQKPQYPTLKPLALTELFEKHFPSSGKVHLIGNLRRIRVQREQLKVLGHERVRVGQGHDSSISHDRSGPCLQTEHLPA